MGFKIKQMMTGLLAASTYWAFTMHGLEHGLPFIVSWEAHQSP